MRFSAIKQDKISLFALAALLWIAHAAAWAQGSEEPVSIGVFDHYTIDPIASAQVSVWRDGELVGIGTTGSDGRVLLEVKGVSTSGEVPDAFQISQNYPNPFTADTRFDITAPAAQSIQYEVYNVLGQRVLVNAVDVNPGRQSVSVPMARFPAGVYFLRVNGHVSRSFKLVKVGSGMAQPDPIAPALRQDKRIEIRPHSLPETGAFDIRVERDRYQGLEFSVDIEPGANLDVYVERLNRVIFRVEDENREPVSQALRIERDDSLVTFFAPDTLTVTSGSFVVATPDGAPVSFRHRLELPSVDTTYVLTADAQATATVAGVVSNTQNERMGGVPVRAYHMGQSVAETQSNAEGRFELIIPADGEPVSIVADPVPAQVPDFDPETYLNYSRAAELITPYPDRSYEISFLLRAEWPMTVAGADPDTVQAPLTLSTPGGSVIVAGIPRELNIVAGSGRGFSPTTDADAFPGEFATRQEGFESSLISGGFVSVNLLRQNGSGFDAVRELRDENGDPVRVQLRFRIDREDWSIIRDPSDLAGLPGYANREDTLSAPLYYYDEPSGDWLLNDSFGWIEDINGAVSPGEIPRIQDGSYPDELYMVGYVTHFTWYNLDHPERAACFTGRLVDQNSNPVPDAELRFYSPPGDAVYSYWSNIQRTVTSPTGHFQVRVPRTERGADDDWNRNNRRDTFRALGIYEDEDLCGAALFDNGGPGYITPDFRERDACRNLGTLRVELRQARKRTINVTFLDSVRTGQPDTPLFVEPPSMDGLNHAVGTLLDPRVPVSGSVWRCVCDGSDLDEACHFQTTTDNAGRGEFTIPVLDTDDDNPLNILEYLTGTFSYRKSLPDLDPGAYEFAGCGYLVAENRSSETVRCKVDRRGPPQIEIVEPAPTNVVDGDSVYHFLFDDPVTLRASGTDVNENSIDHLDQFYWTLTHAGGNVLGGRVHNITAAAAFGVGENRGIRVNGIDFYGWMGSATLSGVTVESVEIALEPDTLRLTPGQSESLVATVTGANDTGALWSSDDASIATVDADGLVTGVGPGETFITARSAADPTKTATAVVEVANLVARFTISPRLGDSTTVFTFDASTSAGDIAGYAWDFGDGNTGSGEVVTHQYAQSLDYTVTLTVTDVDAVTAHHSQTVIASGGVLAEFTATPQIGPPPLTVQFDASPSEAFGSTITAWTWDFGDGQTGSGETVTHTYNASGVYRAKLTVEDDRGRTGTDSLEIRVNTPPVASFTVEPTSGNVPLTVTVNAAASNDPDGQIVRYGWDFGDGSVIEDGDVIETHTYTSDGDFVITLTVEDNDGATASATQNVSTECTDVYHGNVVATTQDDLNVLSGMCRVEGSVSITGAQLTHLISLSDLATVTGDFSISDASNLVDLDGLSQLSAVAGTLTISENPSLENVTDLVNLRSAGVLRISNNGQLTEIALPALANVGDLIIEANPALTVVARMQNLTSIEKDLSVSRNASLLSLTAFENLESVGGDIDIVESVLTDLAGFEQLRIIGGSLTIRQNNDLADLRGLETLERIERNVQINDNSILSQCDVRLFEADLQTSAGIGGRFDALGNAHILTGHVTINNAADLATLADICEVTGNLWIQFTDLTTVTGAESLHYVGGSISIRHNGSLNSLAGLDNLLYAGALEISSNDALEDISALSNLYGAQTLTLMNNPALASLAGLERLHLVHNLTLQDLPALTALPAFDGITLLGSLDIFRTSLVSLAGLEMLESVFELQIRFNSSLTNLDGLNGLRTVTDVDIRSNVGLLSLAGLEGIQTVNGNLLIRSNDELLSLDGLASLERVRRNFDITTNGELTSLSGLSSLQQVEGILWIQQEPKLETLSGLENLTEAGGVTLVRNDRLASLQGLNNLTRSGFIQLVRLPLLETLAGLDRLEVITGNINIGLSVAENTALVSLQGMPALTGIEGPLNVAQNPALTSLAGLENITEIRSVSFFDNASLADFSGLDALKEINGDLSIRRNDSLNSMQGLEAVERIDNRVFIENNSSLPQCEADAFVQQVQDRRGIGGNITMSGNDEAAVCE